MASTRTCEDRYAVTHEYRNVGPALGLTLYQAITLARDWGFGCDIYRDGRLVGFTNGDGEVMSGFGAFDDERAEIAS